MRTRTCDWLNVRNRTLQYGIQVFCDGEWKNAAQDGKPCFFDTAQERDLKRAEIRKMKEPSNAGGKPTQPEATG